MLKMPDLENYRFCPYCGASFADHPADMNPYGECFCTVCEEFLDYASYTRDEAERAREEFIESVEERQHASGFYAFQDACELRRYER